MSNDEDLDSAFEEWFNHRWPTGWWESQRMSPGDLVRDAFNAGYRVRVKRSTKDVCQTGLMRQCKVTAE